MFAIGLVLFVLGMTLDGPRHPADDPHWMAWVPGLTGAGLMLVSVVVFLWRVMP